MTIDVDQPTSWVRDTLLNGSSTAGQIATVPKGHFEQGKALKAGRDRDVLW